jgi:N-methylhydantoinase B/oxoprolinase/acetone carboxylase alpha subunit
VGSPASIKIIRNGASLNVPLLPLEPIELRRNDLIVVQMLGGGGYGPVGDREPELIIRDLREERISTQAASSAYGAVAERG